MWRAAQPVIEFAPAIDALEPRPGSQSAELTVATHASERETSYSLCSRSRTASFNIMSVWGPISRKPLAPAMPAGLRPASSTLRQAMVLMHRSAASRKLSANAFGMKTFCLANRTDGSHNTYLLRFDYVVCVDETREFIALVFGIDVSGPFCSAQSRPRSPKTPPT